MFPNGQLELQDCICHHNKTEQDRINLAEANRDVGILMSEASANDHIEHWSDRALTWVKLFLNTVGDKPFMAEDVRAYADSHGFEKPPHLRAWGGVIVRAAHQNLIKCIGYQETKNPKANCAVAKLWRRA